MIFFDRVTKIYGNGQKALDNVSLKVGRGEFVFLEGDSGAGKTTMLELILPNRPKNRLPPAFYFCPADYRPDRDCSAGSDFQYCTGNHRSSCFSCGSRLYSPGSWSGSCNRSVYQAVPFPCRSNLPVGRRTYMYGNRSTNRQEAPFPLAGSLPSANYPLPATCLSAEYSEARPSLYLNSLGVYTTICRDRDRFLPNQRRAAHQQLSSVADRLCGIFLYRCAVAGFQQKAA